ncbi:MAG: hypothetical protein K2X87_03530 [Gemmataceae bacterium]|nr:hypothetical protein [Gemmataceae bacterium]
MTALIVGLAAFGPADPPPAGTFSAVEIEKRFEPYLTADRLLMEVAGAKAVRLPDGRTVLLAVASTAAKDGSAADRLRAEKVCRTKALAAVVAEKEGVRVWRAERLEERTVVTQEAGGTESARSVSDLLQVTTAQVQGVAKDMPVVGRWRSKDGAVIYLALGVILDKNGEYVPATDP